MLRHPSPPRIQQIKRKRNVKVKPITKTIAKAKVVKGIAEETSININTQKFDDISKRKGRKRERDDVYFKNAQEKITQIKMQLKTAEEDGVSINERKRLRNIVSAL